MEKSSSRTKKVKTTKVTQKNKTAKTAKKSTKQSVPRKVTNKKSAKAQIPLVTAPSEKQFWMNNGQIVADLLSLAESFAAMDDLLFDYHVNESKNDFADWVEHVLEDKQCAQLLRKTRTPKKAHGVIVRRLRYYSL